MVHNARKKDSNRGWSLDTGNTDGKFLTMIINSKKYNRQ